MWFEFWDWLMVYLRVLDIGFLKAMSSGLRGGLTSRHSSILILDTVDGDAKFDVFKQGWVMSETDASSDEKQGPVNYTAIGLSVIAILASVGTCAQAQWSNALIKEQYSENVYRESVYSRAANCFDFSHHYYEVLDRETGWNERYGKAYFDLSKKLAICAGKRDVSSIRQCVDQIKVELKVESEDEFGC